MGAAAVRSAEGGRNDVIDAFRAILIFSVLVFHYLLRWTPNYSGPDLTHYSHLYSPLLQVGKYGVHVFFVISGVVIAMTLLKSREVLEFAFRRFSRLYPALVVAAVVTFLAMRLLGPPALQVTFKDFLLTLTMIPTNLGGQFVDGVYWSLAVEVKFYLWIALAFWTLKGRFWIGLIGVGAIGTVLEFLPHGHGLAVAVLISPYMGFFLAGVALWFAAFERNHWPALWCALAAAALYAAHWRDIEVNGAPSLLGHAYVLGLTAALAVLLLRHVRLPWGPLPYLGRISYSLYLLHQNLGVALIGWLTATLHWPDLLAFAAATAFATALAAASFHGVEVPAQAWLRERYAPLRRLAPHRAPKA